MSAFKDQIAIDNEIVFMNIDEFADEHIIGMNGVEKKMAVIFDSNEMIDREKRYQYKRSLYADGVFLDELLIYVKASEFGPLPKVNGTLFLDGVQYLVSDAVDEDGLYSLSLQANKTSVRSRNQVFT